MKINKKKKRVNQPLLAFPIFTYKKERGKSSIFITFVIKASMN